MRYQANIFGINSIQYLGPLKYTILSAFIDKSLLISLINGCDNLINMNNGKGRTIKIYTHVFDYCVYSLFSV